MDRLLLSHILLSRVIVSVLFTLSLLGATGLLSMTRWGIGTSPDSIEYIRAARELTSGRGWGFDQERVALTHHAPFYSFLLAAGGLAGLDPLEGARWINAAVFGLNIFLVGFVLHRSAVHAGWVPIVGSLLMMISAATLSVHVMAWTEPLFILLSVFGFWMLAKYLRSSHSSALIISAAAIALAFLSRYAGAAVILTGALSVLFFSRKAMPGRIRDAFFFCLVSCLPMLLWMLRNLWAAGTATNREIFLHPIGRSHLWQALYTLSGWFLIPQSAPNIIRFALLLIVLTGLGLILASLFKKRPLAFGAFQFPELPGFFGPMTLFVCVYGGFLAASLSFLDANTPLDNRILSVVYVVGIVLTLSLVDQLWPLAKTGRATGRVVLVLVFVFSAGHLLTGLRLVQESYSQGWGFSSIAWQHSATLAQARKLPAGVPVFSNAPDILYLHTGKSASPIPKKFFPANQQRNPDFPAQLIALKQTLTRANGVVVYFSNLKEQKSLPSEEELKAELALCVEDRQSDGAIFRISGCPQ